MISLHVTRIKAFLRTKDCSFMPSQPPSHHACARSAALGRPTHWPYPTSTWRLRDFSTFGDVCESLRDVDGCWWMLMDVDGCWWMLMEMISGFEVYPKFQETKHVKQVVLLWSNSTLIPQRQITKGRWRIDHRHWHHASPGDTNSASTHLFWIYMTNIQHSTDTISSAIFNILLYHILHLSSLIDNQRSTLWLASPTKQVTRHAPEIGPKVAPGPGQWSS